MNNIQFDSICISVMYMYANQAVPAVLTVFAHSVQETGSGDHSIDSGSQPPIRQLRFVKTFAIYTCNILNFTVQGLLQVM